MHNRKDFQTAKKEILSILKERKVSLSKTRCLFNCILKEIEDNNPITLSLENYSYDKPKTLISSNELEKLNAQEGQLIYTMPSYHPLEK